MEQEVLAILTHARNRARSMMLAPEQSESIKEEQWCSGAMRVTVRRPHVLPVIADTTRAPPLAMPA